jgi:hypothetical protein
MTDKDTTPDVQNKQPSQAYELGKHLFGKHSSGQGNLSADRKAILRSKLACAETEKRAYAIRPYEDRPL